MRKWEVIYKMLDKLVEVNELEKCKEDIVKARDIAKKIDDILVELYEDEQPDIYKLKSIYKTIKIHLRKKYYNLVLIDLYILADTPSLCIACKKSDGCENCLFALRAGECGDRESLFYEFLKTIRVILLSQLNISLGELHEIIECIKYTEQI